MNIKRGAFSNICLLPSPSPGYIVSLTRRLCQSIFSCHISIVTAPTHPPNIWYVSLHMSSSQTLQTPPWNLPWKSEAKLIIYVGTTSAITWRWQQQRHTQGQKQKEGVNVKVFCLAGVLCANSGNRKLCQREQRPLLLGDTFLFQTNVVSQKRTDQNKSSIKNINSMTSRGWKIVWLELFHPSSPFNQ